MAGKSRTVLNKIEHLLFDYKQSYNKIVKDSNLKNSIDHKYDIKNIEIMQEKLLEKIKELLEKHIDFLEKPDPYKREQTQEQHQISTYKLNKFNQLKNNILVIQDKKHDAHKKHIFLQAFDTLKSDQYIDKARFPQLGFHSLYQFFKAIAKPFYTDPLLTKKTVSKSQGTNNSVILKKKK